MNVKRPFIPLLGIALLTLGTSLPSSARAAPSAAAPARTVQAGKTQPRRARASLRLDVGVGKPWIGQPIPVTVTAYFRDVEGVTLEGAPELDSKAIITSNLAREPHESTEIIDGERTLVARWTGTVTPSTTGPLPLSVKLPVRLRYRDAPPDVAAKPEPDDPFDQDPFSALGSGGSIDDIFDRMRKRMMQRIDQPAGPLREEALPLTASAKPLEVRALPSEGRPPTFSGAVGQFHIEASVSPANVHVSEPVTVRIALGGSVDLDRVDLPGIASSEAWKAYLPRALEQAAPAKGAPTKIFEQTIVPLHGGDLTVPPVSFTAFDPDAGTYVTRSTQPIRVAVEGSAPPARPPDVASVPAPTAAPAPSAAVAPDVAPSSGPVPVLSPSRIAMRVVPVLLFVLAAAVVRVVGRRHGERSLRRAMRRAASAADVGAFVSSAHDLIAKRLSERWAIRPEEVTSHSVQERLGDRGRPLVDVLVAREKLRFARGGIEPAEPALLARELRTIGVSVEQALRGAT